MDDDNSFEWLLFLNNWHRPTPTFAVWIFNDNGTERDASTSDGDVLIFNPR